MAGFLAAWSTVVVFHVAMMSAVAVSVCFGDACWQFLLVPFKSDLDSSFITLEKYKEQLMVISEYVSRIEHGIYVLWSQEEIKKLKSKVEEEETKLDSSALMVATECCTEKEKKKVGDNGKQQEVGTEGADNQSQTNTATERTAVEEKAAKIQRLKSGFRICKPQRTFLWPNMVSNNNKNSNTNTSMLSSSQVVVQRSVSIGYLFLRGDVSLGCIAKKVVKKARRWNRTYALKCHISHEVNHLHEGLKHVRDHSVCAVFWKRESNQKAKILWITSVFNMLVFFKENASLHYTPVYCGMVRSYLVKLVVKLLGGQKP
ncbi:hypothetical protein LOK49_Contig380G00002 [Camellia lanceoleosa]|nr:hypothetical protein LOK49_Contig380G00002 [Camellia lanceoleosa]